MSSAALAVCCDQRTGQEAPISKGEGYAWIASERTGFRKLWRNYGTLDWD